MDAEQVGAYLLLMIAAWQGDPPCSLPDNEAMLAKWARTKLPRWSKIGPAVMECWRLENGRWYQDRLAAEYSKSIKRMEIARNNGKGGGRPGKNNPAGLQKEPSGLADGLPEITQRDSSRFSTVNHEIGRLGDSSEKTPKPKTPQAATPLLSDLVWEQCNWRKEAKGKAYPAIVKAIGKVANARRCTPEQAAQYIADKAAQYTKATESTERRFRPLPASWINAERYDDDPADWAASYAPPLSSKEQAQRARESREPEEKIKLPVFNYGETA